MLRENKRQSILGIIKVEVRKQLNYTFDIDISGISCRFKHERRREYIFLWVYSFALTNIITETYIPLGDSTTCVHR